MLLSLYVGVEKDALNHPIGAGEYRDMLNSAERETAETFGGYRVSEVRGGWLDDRNDLIREQSLKFEISVDGSTPALQESANAKAMAWARWMRKRFRQQEVLLTVMNQGDVRIRD